MRTKFEWNPAKARSNLKKHGVSFELASRVFSDPFALIRQDRVEGGEYRWQALGMVEGDLLLLVVHTEREEERNGDFIEVIRIISAREADRAERRQYEQEPR